MKKSIISILLISLFINVSVFAGISPMDKLFNIYNEITEFTIVETNNVERPKIDTLIKDYSDMTNKEAEKQIEEIESNPVISLNIEIKDSNTPLDDEENILVNELVDDKPISLDVNKNNIQLSDEEVKTEAKDLINSVKQDENVEPVIITPDLDEESIIVENLVTEEKKRKMELEVFVLPSISIIHSDRIHNSYARIGMGAGVGLKDFVTFGIGSMSMKLLFTINPTLLTTFDFKLDNLRLYLGFGIDYIIKHNKLGFAFNLGVQYEIINGFVIGVDYTMNNYKYTSSSVKCSNLALFVGKTFSL